MKRVLWIAVAVALVLINMLMSVGCEFCPE